MQEIHAISRLSQIHVIQITKARTEIRNVNLLTRKAGLKYFLLSLPYNTLTAYKMLLCSETFDSVLIGMKIKNYLLRDESIIFAQNFVYYSIA